MYFTSSINWVNSSLLRNEGFQSCLISHDSVWAVISGQEKRREESSHNERQKKNKDTQLVLNGHVHMSTPKSLAAVVDSASYPQVSTSQVIKKEDLYCLHWLLLMMTSACSTHWTSGTRCYFVTADGALIWTQAQHIWSQCACDVTAPTHWHPSHTAYPSDWGQHCNVQSKLL